MNARTRTARTRVPAATVIAAVLALLALLVVPVVVAGVASAAELVPTQTPAPAPAASLDQVLTNARNWVMGIAAAVATLFVTVGALRYMTADGDLGQVERAKSAFRSAGIGYGIAILAPVIVAVLGSIFGA